MIVFLLKRYTIKFLSETIDIFLKIFSVIIKITICDLQIV